MHKRPGSTLSRDISLFNEYLLNYVSRKYFAYIKNSSRTTLWRKFAPLLKVRLLPKECEPTHKTRVASVDGFYIAYPSLLRNRYKQGYKRDKCILLWTFDCETHKPVYWQFYDDIENSGIWERYFREMKQSGIYPEFLTHDGHPGITTACAKYLPKTKEQRCTVHLMFNMRKDLSISPKTRIAKELKSLVSQLQQVKTTSDANKWNKLWLEYCSKYQETIKPILANKATYENGVKISGLYRSAFSVVNHAYQRDGIFTYLNDSSVPNSSNAIESNNGVLREVLSRHRGLSLEQRKNLVSWVLAYKQQQTVAHIKQQLTRN